MTPVLANSMIDNRQVGAIKDAAAVIVADHISYDAMVASGDSCSERRSVVVSGSVSAGHFMVQSGFINGETWCGSSLL